MTKRRVALSLRCSLRQLARSLTLAAVLATGMPASELLAATLTVETTVDETVANGRCSIREAWVNAEDDATTHSDCPAGSGQDTIQLPGAALIALTSGFSVRQEVVVVGNGATLTRPAGLIFSTAGGSGGLKLQELTLDGDGGLCVSNAGGFIYYELHRVTLVRCSLGVTVAAGPDDSVRVLIANSTIQAPGGLAVTTAGESITVDIVNSTITGSGTGVTYASSTVRMANTLLADNDTNCGVIPTLSGANLSDDASCGAASGNLKVVADALIGPLNDNGGPTMTHALLPGSPAIDMASDAICANDPVFGVDQRLATRPQDGDDNQSPRCDIGSYERAGASRAPMLDSAASIVLMGLFALGVAWRTQRTRADA